MSAAWAWRFRGIRTLVIGAGWAVSAIASLPAQNGGNDPRLAADYYTKSWGVPEKATILSILQKVQPEQQDLALIRKVLSNSSPQKLRNIDTSIAGFSKKNPKSDSIELLLDLKAEILEQRKIIEDHIFSQVDRQKPNAILGELLSQYIQTTADVEDIKHLLVRFKALSGLNDPQTTVACFQLIDLAIRNHVLDGNSVAQYPDVVRFLHEQGEGAGPGNFLSVQAKGMLMRMGGSDASAMLQQVLESSMKPSSTVTDLSSSISEFLTLATANPGLAAQYVGEIDRLGEIIARTGHEKLMQTFAKNVRMLAEAFKRAGDTKSLASVVGYLQREKDKPNNPLMAGYAAAELTRMAQ